MQASATLQYYVISLHIDIIIQRYYIIPSMLYRNSFCSPVVPDVYKYIRTSKRKKTKNNNSKTHTLEQLSILQLTRRDKLIIIIISYKIYHSINQSLMICSLCYCGYCFLSYKLYQLCQQKKHTIYLL